MRLARVLAAAAIAAALLITMTSSAAAGEINGKGERPMVVRSFVDDGEVHHILHAKSACAFSGLNDGYIEGEEPDRVQSWGAIPKVVRNSFPPFLHPGKACNPTTGGEEP